MMNWQDINVSVDNTHFLFEGKPIFGKRFLEVLKFHAPGLAPVKDESGSYHIESSGNQLYTERFTRTFGFYCNRSAVVLEHKCFHITDRGHRSYPVSFEWTGNYQENFCPVRDKENQYFHIDLNGNKIYSPTFTYVGDYKNGIACVKTASGFYKHIDTTGAFIYDQEFYDLGVFHKNYATAKDQDGWYHIDKNGLELYPQRYLMIEPFYNGFSVVDTFENIKQIIDENGEIILML